MNNKFVLWQKIDRLSAWILFFGMFLYFITGYGMTKGLIDSKTASSIHLNWLSYVIVFAFVIHTSFAIRLAFMRWKIWNIFTKILLILFYMATIAGFLYVDIKYEKQTSQNNSDKQVVNTTLPNTNNSSNDSDQTTIDTETSQNSSDQTKYFTVEELAKYDGQNGNPPYVAVDGIVYDMTGVFTSGTHYSHYAGQVLTQEFYSRHTSDDITKYPVVGIMK